MLTLRDLIEQPPLIHNDRTITWGIRPALAHFLDDAVGPGSVTLETGAGLSTLVILRKQPRQHTAVQPVPDEFAAILEFAERHRMDIHGFRPIVARSQDWLPRADLPDLDLVLVDGAHAFPVPFLDWYYGAEKLKVGGLMVVDDTHLLTGTMLADFMGADPRWEPVVRDDVSHFAIYRKRVHPVHDDDWTRQPYVHDAYPTERIHVVRAARRPLGDARPRAASGAGAGTAPGLRGSPRLGRIPAVPRRHGRGAAAAGGGRALPDRLRGRALSGRWVLRGVPARGALQRALHLFVPDRRRTDSPYRTGASISSARAVSATAFGPPSRSSTRRSIPNRTPGST